MNCPKLSTSGSQDWISYPLTENNGSKSDWRRVRCEGEPAVTAEKSVRSISASARHVKKWCRKEGGFKPNTKADSLEVMSNMISHRILWTGE
jgi:hypothetical protein